MERTKISKKHSKIKEFIGFKGMFFALIISSMFTLSSGVYFFIKYDIFSIIIALICFSYGILFMWYSVNL